MLDDETSARTLYGCGRLCICPLFAVGLDEKILLATDRMVCEVAQA